MVIEKHFMPSTVLKIHTNVTLMKKLIFVLEDDNELRELYSYLLESDGYKVSTYPDAASFDLAIHTQNPGLVIMDVRLPDGNGIDICNSLKSDARTSAIPIIIMSAHKDLISLKKNSLADDLLEKPFDIHLFLEKVRRLAG